MREKYLVALLLTTGCSSASSEYAQQTDFTGDKGLGTFSRSVLVTGLEGPWEITWGPDNMLWVTERAGRRVTRIQPDSGAKKVAVTIDEVLVDAQHQGLLGMALHPDLLRGGENNYVYVAYTYDFTPGDEDPQDDPRAKVVRLTYDAATETLTNPTELISGVPAGIDHNGGRLKIGPDGMLYYTLGEQGANQFASYCDPIEAQRLPTWREVHRQHWSAYKGKTLRMTLSGDIPRDNPVLRGVRSHVVTYGHRNPQGIVFGAEGTLYEVEHGANTDDEINIIRSGGNYGWPHIAGFRDNQSYAYVNWSSAPNCRELTWTNLTDRERVPPGVSREEETDWTGDFVEPIKTLYTVPNGYDLEDETCGELFFICRPSVAPSSVDYYPIDGPIPGWGGSLLVTSLKNGALYLFKLSGDGNGVRDTDQLFDSVNRYRDLAIGPDGRTFYVATDTSGYTRSADSGATDILENPGSILVFTYVDEWGASGSR
jgi:PQQ-dependent dehydrogenase (s-GDH family)